LRPVHQGHRQLEELLLAKREASGAQMALGMEPDEVEQLLGPAKVFGRTAAEHRSPAQLCGRNADDHVLQATHPAVAPRLLECAQQAEPGALRYAQSRDLA